VDQRGASLVQMVVDASYMLALLLPDEAFEGSEVHFTRFFDEGIVVPAHWNAEISNSMVFAYRKQRITLEYRKSALRRLNDLPIARDLQSIEACFHATIELSDIHRLTIYDAAYLELALRLNSHLATLDKELARAARAEKVQVVGPYA
jgi:predicted nucleic acid-binding protein